MRHRTPLTVLAIFWMAGSFSIAQFQGGFVPGGLGNNVPPAAGGLGAPGQGGGANADFDGLIDLIVSTVASETWAENGGGEAEIRPFAGGIYADAQGTLRLLKANQSAGAARAALAKDLAKVKTTAKQRQVEFTGTDARRPAKLRCVSLGRLEKELAQRIADKKPLDESLLTLAGLRRVEYVFVYPPTEDNPTGEIAIAGPAGDWKVNDERRIVAADTGQPVVRLDDLLTLLRRKTAKAFGCSIDPRAEGLAAAQKYMASHSIPSSSRGRDRWAEAVCERVGVQDLSYMGLAGDSRVACVLGEADYHMKLVGMGKADGVAGMKSYLRLIKVKPGSAAPSVGAVRWWFGMNYSAIESTDAGDAFRIVGNGVKLLSENEAIEAQGQRRPTGRSDEFAQEFANSFTSNFAALCEKYPVYAELRNVFDLSLVVALIQSEGLTQRAGWSPELLRDAKRLPLPKYKAPTTVDTVASVRTVGRRHVLASVSGGVWAEPTTVIKSRARKAVEYSHLQKHQGELPEGVTGWWWDVE